VQQWRTWASAPAEAQTTYATLPSVAALSPTDVVISATRQDGNCPVGPTGNTGGTWVLAPDSGSNLVTQTACFAANNTAETLVRGAFTAAGTFVLAIAGAPTLFRNAGGTWVAFAGGRPSSTLFSDGASVYAAVTNFTAAPVKVMSLSDGSFTTDYTWNFPSKASGALTLYPGANTDRPTYAALRSWNECCNACGGYWDGALYVEERSSGWSSVGRPGTYSGELYCRAIDSLALPGNARVTTAKGAPVVVAIENNTNAWAYAYNRGTGAWTSYQNINTQGGVSGTWPYEVAGQRSQLFFAYVTGGKLYLRRMDLDAASPAFADVPGPSFLYHNVDGTCVAAHAEMAVVDEAIFLSWSENCAGSERIYLRELY
jgi:hypothetical protein